MECASPARRACRLLPPHPRGWVPPRGPRSAERGAARRPVSRRLHELDWWGGHISGLIPGGSTACSDKKETENTHFCPRSPTRDKPRRSAGVHRVRLATGPITSRGRARTGPEGGCQQQDPASAGPRRAGKTSSERCTLRVRTSCPARARVGPCSARAEAAVLRSRRGVPKSAP